MNEDLSPRPGKEPPLGTNQNSFKNTEVAGATGRSVFGIMVPAFIRNSRLHGLLTNLSKKQQMVAFSILGLLVIGGGAGAYALYQHSKRPSFTPASLPSAAKEVPPPAPTTLASPLTGVQVEPGLAQRPVTGVMVENSPDARPQAGLKDAGVVFEAVAEGGITRFLALFQEAQPDHIGPVRSARPYYLDWALTFDASYAHVGGSPEALALIKGYGMKDLDQFANSGAYQRVSNRFAPHNVYTSSAKLDGLNQAKGYTASTFTPLLRKAEAKLPTPTVTGIDLAISSANYNVHYDYNAETNSYNRVLGGKPHTDERSGTQISPKVVVVLVTKKGLAADRVHTTYEVSGSGKVFVFQDGGVTEGTWAKVDTKAQYSFKDGSGADITLNPGQTWVSLVDAAGKVTQK